MNQKTQYATRPAEPHAHAHAPSAVGVHDLCALVLASLSSSAAPVPLTPMAEPVADAPVEAPAIVQVKPAKPPSTSAEVAYVHVPDCIACHACEDACPSQAIEVADFSVIDPSICEACNECVPVCPTNCISLQPRGSYATLEFAVKK